MKKLTSDLQQEIPTIYSAGEFVPTRTFKLSEQNHNPSPLQEDVGKGRYLSGGTEGILTRVGCVGATGSQQSSGGGLRHPFIHPTIYEGLTDATHVEVTRCRC